MKKLIAVIWITPFLLLVQTAGAQHVTRSKGWRAGVASVIITPGEAIWMAGYSSRTHPAEGTLHDIRAKALVLEDGNAKRGVLITLDLVGIPKYLSDDIRNALSKQYLLNKAQIIINCSHTHTGPVLSGYLTNAYDIDDIQKQKIKVYTEKLKKQIIQAVATAIQNMEPASLHTGNGFARFQVNRRNNNEAFLLLQSELKGPNDYAVPVIKIADDAGGIKAIVFGYACHNTVLNGYQWSGDYAGFAQLELEKMYPGATALFFQGAGADQNPLPRRSVPLAVQYGKELAFAVEHVLSTAMTKQPATLACAYNEVPLPLNPPPTKSELQVMAQDSTAAYKRRSALNLLQQMQNGVQLIKFYPYPIQAWKIGAQPLFALGGELVVHYAIAIKDRYGADAFVMGYANDVMAYIPSLTIIKESNDRSEGYAFYDPTNHSAIAYEGGLFTQMVYGLPSTWASDIETVILNGVQKVAADAGVGIKKYQ